MDGTGRGSGASSRTSPDDWTSAVHLTSTADSGAVHDISVPPSSVLRPAVKVHRGPLFSTAHPRSVSLPQALHSFSLSNRSVFPKVPARNANGGEMQSVREAEDSLSSNAAVMRSPGDARSGEPRGQSSRTSSIPVSEHHVARLRSPTLSRSSGALATAAFDAHSNEHSHYDHSANDAGSTSLYLAGSPDRKASVGTSGGSYAAPPSPSSSLIPGPSTPTSAISKRAISEGHNCPIENSNLMSRPLASASGRSAMRSVVRSETTPRISETLSAPDTQLLDPLPGGRESAHYHTKPPQLRGYYSEEAVAQRAKDIALHDSVPGLHDCTPVCSASAAAAAVTAIPVRNTTRVLPPTPDAQPVLQTPSAAERALSNPDILYLIFNALDTMTDIPHEIVQQRRKPLSLRHAQLIFSDNKRALEAWEKSQPTTSAESPGAGLFNCLLVNSDWYDVAVRVLEDRIHFRHNEHWIQFTRRGISALTRKPRMLVLHKLNEATQVELDMIDHANLGENLEWLEFYTCAGLAPPASLLGPQLTRIIIPGCYRVNDRTLALIASKCSKLEHLDVRACEQVSDRGIKMIAKYCPLLQLVNVGRTRGGEHITYKGIKHLARQTQITTLGIAGCDIDDRAIWELALNRGPKLQRLSLNNCKLLTDASVPRVLGYMPNLTVLEIRGCTQITHMRSIALFKAYREKQGQPPLIEGCEVIERRLQVAIMRLQRETSHRILNDLSTWVNDATNDDN